MLQLSAGMGGGGGYIYGRPRQDDPGCDFLAGHPPLPLMLQPWTFAHSFISLPIDSKKLVADIQCYPFLTSEVETLYQGEGRGGRATESV